MSGKRIEGMYAFTTIDEEGDEGIIAELMNGTWFPFIGADMERMESLKERAKVVARTVGCKYTLKRFAYVETLEEYDGRT